MKPKKALKKITGFSLPNWLGGGGLQWDPSADEHEVATQTIRFMQDRRVLYNAYELESPDHCVKSVIEIRAFLTQQINTLDSGSKLIELLETMRSSCRKFLDEYGDPQNLRRYRGSFQDMLLASALGELRGMMAVYLSALAALFDSELPEPLSSMLPHG